MIFDAIGEYLGSVFIDFIGGKILNFIGGTVRWVYGTTWRTIANRPKFKFREYINGPDRPIDEFDSSHGGVNRVIGFIFFIVIILLIV